MLCDIFGEKVPYVPLVHVSPSVKPGIKLQFKPGQHPEQRSFISRLLTRIEKDYHESGLPLYLAEPSRSMIKIMTLEEFNRRSAKELQDLHASHHLLVTGYPEPTFGFDEVGLETLASPMQAFAIHDFSIKIGANQNARQRIGTTSHLLTSHRSPDGKILNALDFPRPHLDHPPTSLASDLFAFRRNSSNQGVISEYPDLEMRWGLAATTGAFSTFHVDSHGRATYVSCVNKDGSKLWVLAGTKTNAIASAFENVQKSIRFFNRGVPSKDQFPEVQLEAVLLQPGMRLYMRPNTPHAVLTTTASICYGGHYLATSCLRETCSGFLITFTLSSLLTNTESTTNAQLLFRQMACFFHEAYTGDTSRLPPNTLAHLPDVTNFDGLLDLFSLCNLLELANILHPDTYTLPGLGLTL
ncbi:hypothetical protein BYT27DRAFT_7110523 [Phlegmacium glaucopus]|nr:hypothetical protein BYT27DRAFT_7110523 [Phlegmacium glaucopus]